MLLKDKVEYVSFFYGTCIYIMVFLGSFLLAAAANTASAEVPQLELSRAYEVEVSEQVDISGIRHCDGKLLSVSDRHDEVVFELTLEGDRYQLKNHRAFSAPDTVSEVPFWDGFLSWVSGVFADKQYDWEGIDCADGVLYLVSESYADVLKIGRQTVQWAGLDLYDALEDRGYFEDRNTYFEGVASLGTGFFLAIEREPRGIVSYKGPKNWHVSRLGPTRLFREEQPQDITDLQYMNRYLYTLERNQHAVCRRHFIALEDKQCWGFDEVLLSDDYRYPDAEYGLAEGLSITDDGIYIAVDNNGLARSNGSTHPMIYHFKFPAGW